MARRTKRKFNRTEGTPTDLGDGIPAPFSGPVFDGPAAQELVAHDAQFLTKSLIVISTEEYPERDLRAEVMMWSRIMHSRVTNATGATARRCSATVRLCCQTCRQYPTHR